MYFALVHYLESYSPKIDEFRKLYDPRVDVTLPHLTFVFPLDVSIGEQQLIDHITAVLQDFSPIKATLGGVLKSWDNFIFLTVKEGSQQIIALHDELYTGILAPFLRKDIEYLPHVTLGTVIPANEHVSMLKAKELDIQQPILIDKLQLIHCRDNETPHEWEKVFTFGSTLAESHRASD
jgi:2'-5' RNA ligase